MSATAGTVGTALVTGSTTGIGRAAALRLARDGWEVIVHGRDAGRGAEVVAAIEVEGGRARFVAADLTDIGEVRRLAEEAGEVDRIINFASWYGMIGNAGTVGYNITKEAVRSPTRTAAREWGRYAITVNVVAPTAKTDAADNIERADPEAMAAAVAAIPAGRLGDPHLDIAPAVLFLATDDARYITARPSAWTEGCFCTPDEAPAESNARIPLTTETARQRRTEVHETTWVGSHRNRRARYQRNRRPGGRHR